MIKQKIFFFLSLIMVFILVTGVIKLQNPGVTVQANLHPMPPHPSIIDKLRDDPSAMEQLNARFQHGIDTPSRFPVPPTGNFNLLVVAVDFPDVGSIVLPGFFDNLFFQAGGAPTGPGSVMDYFAQVSYGTFNLTFVAPDLPGTLGWQTAPNNQIGYYVNADGAVGSGDDYGWGSYPQNLQGIVTDLLPTLDAAVDFSQYDNDGDGFVESIIFVHAGTGAEWSSSPNDIWSSAWNLSSGNGPGPQMVDGVYVDNFLFGPEFWMAPADMTIGVYCHEMGHSLFGLPDLYDLDGSSNGVGNWSVMSFGAWNGVSATGGEVPAWPDAWSRMTMGFDFPMPVSGSAMPFAFPPVETGPGLTVLLKSNQLRPNEYFLIEYRDTTMIPPPNFDQYIPGSGLLVWHIDETKWNTWEHNTQECLSPIDCNCPSAHALVTLEQADGLLDLENATNWGDVGDPFPGSSGNANFTSSTTPESVSYYASTCTPTPDDSCISLQNINFPSPGLILADINTVCQQPTACLEVFPANQLGWGQPGSDTTYRVNVQNCFNFTDPVVTLQNQSNWPATFYDLATGQALPPILSQSMGPGWVWSVGISVTVPTDAHWGDTNALTMTLLSGYDPTYSSHDYITTQVPYCTLLVDDDHGLPDVESSYINALGNGNFDFDYWDMTVLGPPDLTTLAAHTSVVWFTGTPWVYSLHPRDEIALANYLDNGGQLFLSSQEYLKDVDRSAFNREYLRVATFSDDAGVSQINGVPGNPVTNGLGPYTLASTAPLGDQLTPLAPAVPAFLDSTMAANALTHDAIIWKTLYLAWPFENLFQPDADQLMASTMNWFGIPPNPTVSFTPSTSLVCVGDPIAFTNNSLGATAYLWDFGDGITSTLTNPSHSYAAAMNANVTLQGTNCCGMNNDIQSISVIDAPTSSFLASTNTAVVGETITFTNTSTNATTYSWNFGDGSTSTATNPTHTYSAPITATVSLTASNSACQAAAYTQTISIYAPPLAGFTSTSPVLLGDAISFTNTSSNAQSYLWNFGDGVGTSTEQHPSYIYAQAGTYTVTLTASNPAASNNYQAQVTVYQQPIANFSMTEPAGVGQTVTFTNTSSYAQTYLWDFGDGVGTSTDQHPSYSYTQAGTYTVTLTASNPVAADIYQVQLTVYQQPIATFSVTSPVNVGQTVIFTNTSSYAETYLWDFGDGVGTSTDQHPTYNYTQAGTYTVTLRATNPIGTDIVTQQVQVVQGNYAVFLPLTTQGISSPLEKTTSWHDLIRAILHHH